MTKALEIAADTLLKLADVMVVLVLMIMTIMTMFGSIAVAAFLQRTQHRRTDLVHECVFVNFCGQFFRLKTWNETRCIEARLKKNFLNLICLN